MKVFKKDLKKVFSKPCDCDTIYCVSSYIIGLLCSVKDLKCKRYKRVGGRLGDHNRKQ